jgi:hypothetical protein
VVSSQNEPDKTTNLDDGYGVSTTANDDATDMMNMIDWDAVDREGGIGGGSMATAAEEAADDGGDNQGSDATSSSTGHHHNQGIKQLFCC